MPASDPQLFRLLIASSDLYPPFRVDVSVLFGEELASRGHQIDWILQSEQACSASHVAAWGGGRVWVGPTDLGTSVLRRLRKHLLGICNDFKLFGLLRRGNYDVVEVKDKFIAGVFALIAARLYGKRFVYWLSFPFPEESIIASRDGTARYPLLYRIRGEFFRIVLYRLLLPAADHVFVQSAQMRSDVAKEGIPLHKMTAVPMGVKLDASSASPPPGRAQRRLIPAGETCLLYLGTLVKARRLDFMVRVLARVREEVPTVKLYVVGRGEDPSDEALLTSEARRLGVEDALILKGQMPRIDALQYVREADVCLSPFYPMPALNSTSPTKLVEYMAMGKVVVANDHPEQRLLIEESGGGRCVPYDEDCFARAAIELLNAPELAAQMGVQGQRYAVEHRSYGRIADSVEQELLKIVAGPR